MKELLTCVSLLWKEERKKEGREERGKEEKEREGGKEEKRTGARKRGRCGRQLCDSVTKTQEQPRGGKVYLGSWCQRFSPWMARSIALDPR